MTLEEFVSETFSNGLRLRNLIVCNDGFSMSVQGSSTHYCTPRMDVESYEQMEVGFPSNDEPLLFDYAEEQGAWTKTVYGYVPVSLIQDVITKHGGINVEESFKVEYAVINKTPHPVNICDTDGNVIRVYERDETPIRLKQIVLPGKPLPDGTPTTVTAFGDPVGLPEYRAGVFYIVSQLVKSALPSRRDLLVPAEVVRDEAGNIIGCKSLGR